MAKDELRTSDNPKLLKRKLKSGDYSLYLVYYLGYNNTDKGIRAIRKQENLKLTLYATPKTTAERNRNRETISLAKKIRFEREQELKSSRLGYRLKARATDFTDYFGGYIANYTKKDKPMFAIALKRFEDFLQQSNEYHPYTYGIKPPQLTKPMMQAFADYLKTRSRGEGANAIFKRFKKVVKHAFENDLMPKNPCNGVTIRVDGNVIRKAILSPDEVAAMAASKPPRQNPEIRRAFLFCLYTGLRWCDVSTLDYSNVDYSNKLLTFEQHKTEGHSSASGVIIPLSPFVLNLIGKPRKGRIFDLPTYNACNRSVQRWAAYAGITKHISWHCARHSFAVSVLNQGANIKTLSALLGHSSLQHTEKYLRAVDALKRAAVLSLPDVEVKI